MTDLKRLTPTRPYTRLLSLSAGVALAVVTTVPAAAATTPTGPRVSLAEAVLTLPAAAELPPGNVTGFTETTVPKPTGVNPCNLAKPRPLSLYDNGAAIGIYSTPAVAPVAQLAQWVVSTRVFADTKTAHSAITRLGAAEKLCPTLTKVKGMTYKRTWSQRYVTAGGWHGYHTVDVITLAGKGTQLRHIAVYLQKGNALIQVDEIATVAGHSSQVQEARRLTVQKQLAARVSAAAVS